MAAQVGRDAAVLWAECQTQKIPGVLGQAAAYQPASRSLPTAQTAPVPSEVPPLAVMPSPLVPLSPLPGHRITAPLGSATKRLIEVTGAGTPLRIGSADLGDLLESRVWTRTNEDWLHNA